MAKKAKSKLAREIGDIVKSQRRVVVREIESEDAKVASSELSYTSHLSNEDKVVSPEAHLKPSRRITSPKKRMKKKSQPI